MNGTLPIVYLARHGETVWSKSGQHTGLTDLPLTDHGEQEARQLYERLAGIPVDRVFTSPLQRAQRTCSLAGFGAIAAVDPDLLEWDYGVYEGLKSAEIHARRPGWQIYRDGCPGGESPAQVAARADRVINHLRGIHGHALVFSSSHFLRMLVARWLGLDPVGGSLFNLDTASVSALGYEHMLSQPVIRFLNDTRHLAGESARLNI
jgi:broad specificity phosphatase PhoE